MEYKRILITVKTYPHPDPSDLERVCTAGFTEDGAFVRLYPVPLRYLPAWQNYKKYQWIGVNVEKHGGADRRPESFLPDLDSIVLEGLPLSTAHGWRERKEIVFKHPVHSMEELEDLRESHNTSLGVVKPRSIEDLVITEDEENWKPGQMADLAQLRLGIGPKRLPLVKIPYKFRFRFRCPDSRCKGHGMSLADWEAGVLYLRQREKTGSPRQAAQAVREKFFRDICSTKNDVHFFVGTVNQYGTWIVLGVFYPPIESQSDFAFNDELPVGGV